MQKPHLRDECLAAAKTIVLKIGSAVLAGSNELNYGVLKSIACQVAAIRKHESGLLRRIIIVSSGAVAAGKTVLRDAGKKDFSNDPEARRAIAAVGQSLLMSAWAQAFAPHGIITSQVLLTRDDLRSRSRFQAAANTFVEMLSWGVVPIVNENDTVSISDLKFGDNDCLASLLVNLIEADLFVNLTSAPGVLDGDPSENTVRSVLATIPDIEELDIDKLCGAKTELGSGGMHSKLLAARRVSQLGVPTLILPGKSAGVLLDAFDTQPDTQPAGTWIAPAKKSIPRRKFWLAYQSEPRGTVEVDKGAAEALLHQGRSLLPGGITNVAGVFAKGSLLRVIYGERNLGVGFSNYDSEDLKKIKGLKRHEVAAILGQARYPDVIHRDNLLLDAAI